MGAWVCRGVGACLFAIVMVSIVLFLDAAFAVECIFHQTNCPDKDDTRSPPTKTPQLFIAYFKEMVLAKISATIKLYILLV
jgi:hypothetical protein